MTACGSNSHQSSDTGSISFNLQLSHPTTLSRAAAATSADICTDYGIIFININLLNSSDEAVATGSWSCSAHEGTIYDVPAGTGYIIKITGTVTGGIIAWRGEMSGVVVTAGETTPAGIITMEYAGSDDVLPYIDITSFTPSSDATNIPVTSMITARFSEKMAASTINNSTFILNNGTTSVSGSVVYDAVTSTVTPKAIFLPSDNLLYSTRYTVTLTTDIEDMAGNKMEVYSWSFTTEGPPPPDTPPAAPEGIIAASGNRQITLTWDAVPAATSYNIYWSKVSGGVSTVIPNKTTLYQHTGLTNGEIYYYVLTSVNSYGESIESYEIASAPSPIDTNFPTGSVTINNKSVYTSSTDVTLSLLSSSTKGVSSMCISNNTDPCSSWEPYTSAKPWKLMTGDGTKSVFAQFKDSAGNTTSIYGDDIILDETPPTDGILTVEAGDGQVSLSWSGFSDATSGIGSYKLVYSTAEIPVSCSTGTEILSGTDTSYTHNILSNGTTYYYRVCAVDNAGNVSDGSF